MADGWYRRIDQCTVVAATVLVAARDQGELSWFWESSFGRDWTWLPPALLMVAGVVGVFQPFDSLGRRGEVARERALSQQLFDALGDVINTGLSLVRASRNNAILEPAVRMGLVGARNPHPLRVSDFGLHVWKLDRFHRRLVRVRTVRLSQALTIHAIRFDRDKGVIGRCWRTNHEVSLDLLTESEGVRSESDWWDLGEDVRMGLSYAEHVATRHRGAILAMPIRRRGTEQFAGCVSVDLPFGYLLLKNQEVRNRLRQLCVYLSETSFDGL